MARAAGCETAAAGTRGETPSGILRFAQDDRGRAQDDILNTRARAFLCGLDNGRVFDQRENVSELSFTQRRTCRCN